MIDPLFWLYADNFRTYNIAVSRAMGGDVLAAVYFSELAQRFKYHKENGELINDAKHGEGWFYYTSEKCEERTDLSNREQVNAAAKLIRMGFIEQCNFGVPCKKHFRLNLDKIQRFFLGEKDTVDMPKDEKHEEVSKSKSSLLKNDKLVCRKTTNWFVEKRQTGHIYEEQYKEKQHKEKQQQQPAAPVVVVSPDQEKERVLDHEKIAVLGAYGFDKKTENLLMSFPLERIKLGVEIARQNSETGTVKNLKGFIRKAIEEGWDKNTCPGNDTELNRSIAKSLDETHGNTFQYTQEALLVLNLGQSAPKQIKYMMSYEEFRKEIKEKAKHDIGSKPQPVNNSKEGTVERVSRKKQPNTPLNKKTG